MSYKIKIYIVEDEYITQAVLKNNVEEIGYSVVGMADSAEQAWEDLQKTDVDLALLDINLAGEKDGIWLAKKIRATLDIPFIFLTAYGDRATINTAVKTQPNGYLLKPFNEVDIYTAIEVALNNYNHSKKVQEPAPQKEEESTPEPKQSGDVSVGNDQTIYLKIDKIFYKIKLADICYVKSDSNYVEVFLENKKHLVRSTLKNFSDLLPKNMFIQVHRSYIVNINRIESIGDGEVRLNYNKNTPLSANYKDAVIETVVRK
ncbi:response regulator [bacterium SCSIO 12643]|nr:response regulator [bacterium SCSIO 12643]